MSAAAPASASPAPTRHASPSDGLAPGGRVDALTGLRFLAALAVFAHHFTGLGGPESGVARVPAFFPYTTMGVHGVGFFFVLSGFLLAWGYRPGTPARLFYWRRAGRIWPAHLVAGLIALVLLFWWGGRETDTFSVLASVLLVQTWFPGVTPALPGNSVAWTLSVELFFYALFPLLVRAALALRTRTLLAVSGASLAVMAAVNLWLLTHHPVATTEWVMRHPLARLPEFGLGLAAALALRRGTRPALRALPVAALLGAYTVAYTRRAEWAGEGAVVLEATVRPVVALLAVGLVVACVVRATGGGGRGEGWLASPAMVRLGLWSYAFYLLHQTLNYAITDRWGHQPAGGVAVFTMIGTAVVATALAGALYHGVEEPARRWWAGHPPRWVRGDGDLGRARALLFSHRSGGPS
ncbi:acyltransferase family protein [Streptomyces sp. NPDC058372]|uniref:acyltransferase family protein n=1 Tax=Streptomyces sp. NPDC058372 TaxID=3346464 RepID=UPI003663975A